VITIPKSKLTAAHRALEAIGFSKQHERIMQLLKIEGDTEYRCMMGFENADDDAQYEVHFSFMSRKIRTGAKTVPASDIRVVSYDDLPASVQETIQMAEEALEQL
jgi:hypothetical protein